MKLSLTRMAKDAMTHDVSLTFSPEAKKRVFPGCGKDCKFCAGVFGNRLHITS
jgi:hypothetical protein